jgi:hypothetical protein
MNIYLIIYSLILFLILSPGILCYFPSKNHLITVGIHAIIFGIIWQLTYKVLYQQLYNKEGFIDDSIYGLIGILCLFAVLIFAAWVLSKFYD